MAVNEAANCSSPGLESSKSQDQARKVLSTRRLNSISPPELPWTISLPKVMRSHWGCTQPRDHYRGCAAGPDIALCVLSSGGSFLLQWLCARVCTCMYVHVYDCGHSYPSLDICLSTQGGQPYKIPQRPLSPPHPLTSAPVS